MLIFKFAGNLRRFYRQISLNVDTPAQGLRLLLAQDFEFKKPFSIQSCGCGWRARMLRNLRCNGIWTATLKMAQWFCSCRWWRGISAAAAAWIAVAVSVASVAYSVYMSRNMKTKTSAEAAETNTLTNNSFTSAENRVGGAGRCHSSLRNGGRLERYFTRHRHKQQPDWTESIS